MDILNDNEIDKLVSVSKIIQKYNEVIDRESAYEILTNKLNAAAEQGTKTEEDSASKSGGKEEKSTVEKVLTSTTARQVGRTVARELTRGLLGVLGIGGSTRKKKTSWF